MSVSPAYSTPVRYAGLRTTCTPAAGAAESAAPAKAAAADKAAQAADEHDVSGSAVRTPAEVTAGRPPPTPLVPPERRSAPYPFRAFIWRTSKRRTPMSRVLEAKTAMRRLAAEAATLAAPGGDLSRKNARLDRIEAEMRSHQETLATLEGANRFAFLGDSIESDDMPTSWAASKSFGGAPLTPSVEQLKALHYAATSKQSLRLDVDTKTPFDLTAPGIIPPQLAPGILAFRREPFRVASLFPSSGTGAPSVEYVQHTSTTGVATVVAAGAAKPELTLVTTTVTAYARKIAAHIGVLSETLADFQTTAGYVTQELVNALIAAENAQLLTGSGVAPNMQGILTTTGVLTRTQAAAPETALDTLELAMTDLRVGSSFTEPTGFVMHPSDLSAVRHLKDTQGRYLVGAPTDAAPATLWGKPVVLTTSIAAKTVLCGNFAEGGQLLVREGVRMETSNSSGTDFTSNVVRFLGELREALLIFRPSMFIKVTLL